MRQLSAFHARWWASAELDALDWLPLASAGAERFQRDFTAAWSTLSERLHATPEAATMGERVAQRVPLIKEALASSPSVFLHADLRDENLFFIDEGMPTMVAVDWQHCRRGRAPFDVATYLFGIAAGMTPHEEGTLLAEYHRALTRAGVEGYSFEECVRDYQLAMVDRFVNVGSTLASVDPDSAGGQMALEYLSRCGMVTFLRCAQDV
jgi:thiamine kinase-like enzyme